MDLQIAGARQAECAGSGAIDAEVAHPPAMVQNGSLVVADGLGRGRLGVDVAPRVQEAAFISS